MLSEQTRNAIDSIVKGKPFELTPEFQAIDSLYYWSENYQGITPFTFYLDLIGYSDSVLGTSMTNNMDVYSFSTLLGYKEFCLLGKALLVFKENGYEIVFDYIKSLTAGDIYQPEEEEENN